MLFEPVSTFAFLVFARPSCGIRSDLPDRFTAPECVSDRDCSSDLCNPAVCDLSQGTCKKLPTVICDDPDECTSDHCDPESGICVFDPLSFDLDNDGRKGPRPGFSAGQPGSCGDDCDDTSPLAFPGGEEICDGVDNDCNGVVDDGSIFVPTDSVLVQISVGKAPADATGFGWSGDKKAGYLAAFTGSDQESPASTCSDWQSTASFKVQANSLRRSMWMLLTAS